MNLLMEDIHYSELDVAQLARLEPLWKKLNQQHLDNSNYFHQHFANMDFSQRSASLLAKETLHIFIATHKDSIIGYCIASFDRQQGEIESIFIEAEFRQSGIGSRLMELALDCLHNMHCQRIRVAVAEGNDIALEYYQRFGFRPRLTIMELPLSPRHHSTIVE